MHVARLLYYVAAIVSQVIRCFEQAMPEAGTDAAEKGGDKEASEI